MARRCRRLVVAGLVASIPKGSGAAERLRADGRQTPLKALSNILSWQDGPRRAVGGGRRRDRRRVAILSWGFLDFAAEPTPPRAATLHRPYHAPFRRRKHPTDMGGAARTGHSTGRNGEPSRARPTRRGWGEGGTEERSERTQTCVSEHRRRQRRPCRSGATPRR